MSIWDTLFKRTPSPAKPTPATPRTFSLETEADAKSLQSFLCGLGYLDPPADGKWGGTSMRALADCLERVGRVGSYEDVSAGRPLPLEVERALHRAAPLPCDLGTGAVPFLERVVSGMLRQNIFLAKAPGYTNIVTAEGHNLDGTRNDDRRDSFNDVKFVFTFDSKGVPVLLGKFEATSTPGIRWTKNPMNSEGAFNIDLGWQKAWSPGDYHGQALLQVRDLSGTRDNKRAGVRDAAHPVRGAFGVHHHQGYNLPRDEMRNASAGCQVIRQTQQQESFMRLVLNDPRYVANHGYVFAATVLGQQQVPEA